MSRKNSIECFCKQCGKAVLVQPSRLKTGHGKFCSRKCKGEWQSNNMKGEKHPRWNGGKPRVIAMICKQCGKSFFPLLSSVKQQKGNFCCHPCFTKWNKGINSSRYKNENKITKICIQCKKKFIESKGRVDAGHGKFCSRKCKSKWQHENICGNKHPNWQGGLSFEPYCFKFNGRRKRAVRDFFDNLCICCGKYVTENIIQWKNGFKQVDLCVHHVDHDKEQGCNGKPFNLVPFCNTCHAKEGFNQEEYRQYVNKTLQEGFNWGIWNEEEYQSKVMYDE